MQELAGRPAAIRAVITQFLRERWAAKQDKLKDDDQAGAEKLREQFQHNTWLEDAAQRSTRLQLVTHSLKPMNPYARGTNLLCRPLDLPPLPLVSSHCLGDDFVEDVVGDAGALDVYKFLKLEYEGRSLLSLMLADDADMRQALSDAPSQAQEWQAAFTGLLKPRGRLASHPLVKQVYWLVGEDPAQDDDFHLLGPMYPTSLVHQVHQKVKSWREDWFSDAGKEARKAHRNKLFHEHPASYYAPIAVQKLGGTKPQVISQLNSERGGNNYLFASLPPVWQARELTPLLKVESIFKRFERQDGVGLTIKALRDYLETNPRKTMHTRDTRDELAFELISHFVLFGVALRTLPEGWSQVAECRLHPAEKVWVDAGVDAERPSDWVAQLAGRYANWLNSQLSSEQRLHMADPEYLHWQKDLADELAAYDWELQHAN